LTLRRGSGDPVCLATTTEHDDGVSVWGFHAGQGVDPRTFIDKCFIGIAWAPSKDLSTVIERGAFNACIAYDHPERAAKGALSVSMVGGQLYKFVHVLAVGDLVAYPLKGEGGVHIGRITDRYRYDRSAVPGYPHLRPTSWVRSVPKSSLSQGAQRELGSVLGLFRVKTHADEIKAIVSA
jgi:predicted Mrr-cat superfamily restriction endonuclease